MWRECVNAALRMARSRDQKEVWTLSLFSSFYHLPRYFSLYWLSPSSNMLTCPVQRGLWRQGLSLNLHPSEFMLWRKMVVIPTNFSPKNPGGYSDWWSFSYVSFSISVTELRGKRYSGRCSFGHTQLSPTGINWVGSRRKRTERPQLFRKKKGPDITELLVYNRKYHNLYKLKTFLIGKYDCLYFLIKVESSEKLVCQPSLFRCIPISTLTHAIPELNV